MTCAECTPMQKAGLISGGVAASYLAFYSAYDKKTKKLMMKPLVDIFSFGDLRFSMLQLNKVAGLSALSIGGLALMPAGACSLLKSCQAELLKVATYTSIVHAAASLQLFYNLNPMKVIKGAGKNVRFEVPALFAASVATVLFYLQTSDPAKDHKAPVSFLALALAVAHFYFIETPTGLPEDLPCRPYAYTSLALTGTALGSFAVDAIKEAL